MNAYVAPDLEWITFFSEDVTLGPSGFDQDLETPAIPIDLF